MAIAGTALQQASFRAGALTASLPTMTVTEPVVGSACWASWCSGRRCGRGRRGWFALVAAVAVMVVATVALARGEAATPANPPEARPVRLVAC